METKLRHTEKVNVRLMAVVEGNKPNEQTEYLMCQTGYRHVFITAYLKGNGLVKLFTLQNYIKWEHHDLPVQSIDITQDEYNDDTVFEHIIEHNFLSLAKR